MTFYQTIIIGLFAPIFICSSLHAQISAAYCPEISIKTASIKSLGKAKKYELSVTIVNSGSIDAGLRGDLPSNDDDAGWRLYLSSDERWNGGDILVAGDYFEAKQIKEKQVISETFEIKIGDHNSFMRYLILCFDPTEQLMECDETNNTFSMPLPK